MESPDVLQLFRMDKEEHIYYQMRPNLTERQRDLFSCWSRREVKQGDRVPEDVLLKSLSCVNYETDIALFILQRLDDHYLTLCADKLKRSEK